MSETPRYPKHVFWSDQDQGFIAIAPDLPGSSSFGETEAEALTELDQAIEAWIEAARAAGNAVPAPFRPASLDLPSGKVLVRMPKGLHRRAALCAEREDVSLNQFIVACVAEAVGERRAREAVNQVHSDPVHQIHRAVGSWVQGSLSTPTPSTTAIQGMGTVVCDTHGWRTAHTLSYFDPIEISARTKQDLIWNTVETKAGKVHARS